jgi:ATP-binding cassette, subfamily B, bacterial
METKRRPAERLLGRVALRSGGWVALVATGALAEGGGTLLLPAALGRAVDAALRGAPGWWAAAAAGVVALIVAGDALGQLATGASGASGTAWLRRLLARHVLAAGPGLDRAFPTGDAVSRLVGATTDAGVAPAAAASSVASALPALGAPVALALIDPRLAVAFVAGLPPLLLVLRAFVRDTSSSALGYRRAQGAIAARLHDAIAGARTIAAAGTVERESDRVLAPMAELRAAGLGTWRAVGRVTAQGVLLVPLLQAVVLAVGGLELAAGRVSPGGLLAASQYAVLGSGIGVQIAYLSQLGRARAGAQRVAEVLAVPAVDHGTRVLPARGGDLELRGVTVRQAGQAVLDRLDLVVPAGAIVAVVGRSGSGKSLLAALAGRLVDPDEGEVLLDGVPLRELGRRELRRAVQYAFARPALLGDSIGGAIRFGGTVPPPELVEAAARAACADQFIRRLPDGYETALGEVSMSGGEVQRIGLARAFAHAPGARLLILDDATSSLDTATEMQVTRALTGHAGQTRLVIAHRAATAARAGLVAWLDGGRIRACGAHRELWTDPAYRSAFEPS